MGIVRFFQWHQECVYDAFDIHDADEAEDIQNASRMIFSELGNNGQCRKLGTIAFIVNGLYISEVGI